MEPKDVYQQIATLGVVPVITIDDPNVALQLADALLAGGLPLVEVTFRTKAAARAIEMLAAERPNLLVGAGTILTHENLEAARFAGARFGVAPGLNPEIVRAARESEFPFVPGVATPSEIEQALTLGCSTLKFFPAEAFGGVETLNAFAGPYAHTGVRFVPTGGVSPANLESYLACKVVAAVGGTWIARKEELSAGNWEEIRRRCAAAIEVVQRVRKRAG